MDAGELAELILSAWRIADKREHVDDYPIGVPELDDIKHLLNIAFYSSIQQEEGRFVTFSLMFIQTHKQTRPRHAPSEYNSVLRLASPIELTVEALRKLSGAIDERTSSLIVEKQEQRLVVTGILPFGYAETLLSAPSGGYPRPEALTIGVRAPGSLRFSRGSVNLGRFLAGAFEPSQPTALRSTALGARIREVIAKHPAYQRNPTSYAPWYFDALRHLLRSAAGKGHGGSIIWIPREHASAAIKLTRLGHAISGFSAPHDELLALAASARTAEGLLRAIMVEPNQVPAKEAKRYVVHSGGEAQSKRRLSILMNAIAQLTTVDGATIVTDYFEPLAFGVRLSADQWVGPIKLATTGGAIERGRYGTRHNSAIDFVGACPEVVSFVLSQDGPVRAFERRDACVLMWPDCLNSMFVE